MTIISRKNFLKISLLGLLGAGFSPGFQTKQSRRIQGVIGRIATDYKIIPVYQEPSYDSEVVRETVFDELLHLYFEKEVISEEFSPQLWYRVWGGYLPGTYVQQTRYRLNQPIFSIPDCGRLAEITVPYSEAFTFSEYTGWKKKYRLYYETTHWLTGINKGPDGKNWYELTSQLSRSLVYYVRREHLRPVQDVEYLPTSIHVPPEQKLIKVSLKDQTLSAFEGEKLVFNTKISSGLGYNEVSLKKPNATATPQGGP